MADQTGTAESVQEDAIDTEDELIASLIVEPGYTGKLVVNAENKQGVILFIEPDGVCHEVINDAGDQGLPGFCQCHLHGTGNDQLYDQLSGVLAEENIVGWFQDHIEFSPRALGSRSVIGDPRSKAMQSVMNLKIKYRESFRPFASAVLAEHESDCFEQDRPSPYMLIVAPVQEKLRIPITEEQENLFGIEKLNVSRSTLPAITHVDYSARIQTIYRETNPAFHALLEQFHAKTGCPVLVNTPFNVRGEPIVNTPEDAYRCFMRTEMDCLVIENDLLKKSEQPVVEKDDTRMQEFELDCAHIMHTIEKLDSKGLRKFGLMTGAIIVVLFGLLLPWLLSHGWSHWPWILAALLWASALLYPKALGPVYTGWMKFGAVAGFINIRIIMAILYYLVVVPIELVMRMFGHDPMLRKLDGESSYRIESKPILLKIWRNLSDAGFNQGSAGIYTGREEVLAGSNYSGHGVAGSADRPVSGFSSCSVYLHTFLSTA